MKTFTEKEMLEFAKYFKNYTSPKEVETALLKFQFLKSMTGIACQTGDRFARVKPDGSIHSVYEMCWLYRPSDRKGVRGRYFTTAYNLLTHYVRTPQRTATPFLAMQKDWDINMFLQALRYIPGDDADWKDPLYRIIGEKDGSYVLAKEPVPVEWFKLTRED